MTPTAAGGVLRRRCPAADPANRRPWDHATPRPPRPACAVRLVPRATGRRGAARARSRGSRPRRFDLGGGLMLLRELVNLRPVSGPDSEATPPYSRQRPTRLAL